MKITRQSQISGITRTLDLDITEDQINQYERGSLLQDSFPNLSPDEREFIKSGITKEEWDQIFGEED